MCKRNDRYGVRLVGTSDPIAIRPVNMRTIVGMPVYRERPRELEATMCEIKAHGVQSVHSTVLMMRTNYGMHRRVAQVVACLSQACEGIGRATMVISESLTNKLVL